MSEDTTQLPLAVEQDPQLKVEQKIKAPDHCQFQKGEIFPMRGYNFEFVGYTNPDFMLVFKARGMTKKAFRHAKENQK